ncbi:DNA-directed RNA polymerase subunit L [Candidatus Woesearchaeota archaeon]|nr:DNA-directed RNA polymerase subunit L [Candidatus Woesearchaeota archaeon]MBT7237893.1 DNA-directed RNA polymerase subunit L [Candidatus Woesearchaeota archaeon]
MELKILSSEKDSLKLELIGEDHTLANALRTQLWKNSGVKLTGYNIEHPLISNPILTVEGNDPKKMLLNAVAELKKSNSELIKVLK